MRREKLKREKQKAIRKTHDQFVEIIASEPDILEKKIGGLSKERLLCPPIKFPELRKPGQETGDLIFIWSPQSTEWEILVIEVITGAFQNGRREERCLMWTFNYLKHKWRKLFELVQLNLPKGTSLWIRTVVISYSGTPFSATDFFIQGERRTRIR